jgi:hypothetical protein
VIVGVLDGGVTVGPAEGLGSPSAESLWSLNPNRVPHSRLLTVTLIPSWEVSRIRKVFDPAG